MTNRVPIEHRLALTVPEVAALVGVSPESVRRLVNEGVLARVPHTGRVLVARREVVRWVESTMTPTPTTNEPGGAMNTPGSG